MKCISYSLIKIDRESVEYLETESGFKLRYKDPTGYRSDYEPRWGHVEVVHPDEKYLQVGDYVLMHHRSYEMGFWHDDELYYAMAPNNKQFGVKVIFRDKKMVPYGDVHVCRPIKKATIYNGMAVMHKWQDEHYPHEATIEVSTEFRRGDKIQYLNNSDYYDDIKNKLWFFIQSENIVMVNDKPYGRWVEVAPEGLEWLKKKPKDAVEAYQKNQSQRFAKVLSGEHKGKRVMYRGAQKVKNRWFAEPEDIYTTLPEGFN